LAETWFWNLLGRYIYKSFFYILYFIEGCGGP
jgi:hypothetical protein